MGDGGAQMCADKDHTPPGYPASFTTAIHGILSAKSYVEAVRDEARASGDTCSRVVLVGSVCGAQYVCRNLYVCYPLPNVMIGMD